MKCKLQSNSTQKKGENVIDIQYIQHRNPRVPCKSGIIPTIDLTKWADYPTGLDPHQFVIKVFQIIQHFKS